ncbi:MAG: iron ABC transporter permease [Alphaproteobacteria bacterium]|nr:iron ABC transporter permease [Alphaproteobacteria bacterium]
MKSRGGDWLRLAVPAAGMLAAVYLIAVPLGMLIYAAFRGPADFLPLEPGAKWTLDNVIAVFSDETVYGRVIPDTLIFVAGTVTLTTFMALILAWLVERTDLRHRNLWFAIIVFPTLVPLVVKAIAWILLMSPNAGWANLGIRWLMGWDGKGPINLFSMGGLIFTQSLATAPFVFLQMSAALRSMNPALEEASRASGASPMTTFRKVTFPVLLPGLLAPVILVTLITFEQFELPLIIGLPAGVNVFAFRIYNELNPASGLPNYGGAAAVSLPFLALGFLALLAYNRAIKNAERFVTVSGKAYVQKRIPLGRWRWPAYLFLIFFAAFSAILPVLVLVWTSFFGFSAPGNVPLSQASMAGYASAIQSPVVWRATLNSFIVAGLSAVIVTILGALVAWVVVRSQFPGRKILDALTFTSLGIPSVIAGLSVMLVYLSLPIGIYGTVWILVLAYSYRLAVTTRIARAAIMQVHKELEEASQASGAKWAATQLRIVLPLILPGLLSAFLLLFIIGMREFTIPFVLYSQENVVLSVLIWQLFQGGQPAHSAALGILMIVLVIPVIVIARRLIARSGSGD